MFAELSTLVQRIIEQPSQAFGEVVPIALIGAGAVIVLHLVFTLFSRPAAPLGRARWRWWEKVVYLAALVSVALLASTAFYSVVRLGAMSGWLLFAHMIGAGAFVAVLPLIAIAWCEANRFGAGREERDSGADAQRFFWLTKLMFWLILAGGLVAASTMLASMLPVFGTAGLLRLLDIHRYSSLLVVVAMLFHFYGVGLQRFGRR